MADKIFNSRLDAHRWLVKNGYKLSMNKMYGDVKKGLLIVDDNGTVSHKSVERYIRAAGLRKLGEVTGKLATLADEKMAEEVKQLKLKNEALEFKNEVERGKYISKREFDHSVTSRAVVLDQGVRNFFIIYIPEMIANADGDVSKANVVLDQVLKEWGALMNDYISIKNFKTKPATK